MQALRKQCSAGLTIFMTLRYAVYGTLLFAPTYRPPQSRWVLEQVLYGQLTRLSSLRESGYARLLYCRVITWYYPLALKVFRMGMGPLQWNETHSSGGDNGFSQCSRNGTFPTCLEWKWWLYSPWVSLYLILTVALLSLQLISEMQSFHSREEIFSSGKRRRMSASSVIWSVYV